MLFSIENKAIDHTEQLGEGGVGWGGGRKCKGHNQISQKSKPFMVECNVISVNRFFSYINATFCLLMHLRFFASLIYFCL